jgi:hypothetical protein
MPGLAALDFGKTAGGMPVVLEPCRTIGGHAVLLAMTEPSTSHPHEIPESLRLQLAAFRRELWRIKILEAVAAGFIGLFASFLLVFALDRVWQTPGLVRLLILLGGVSLFAVFAPMWLHRWVWKRRREDQLARLIARRFPGLGDRLLGVIELQNQSGSGDTLSPRLREAAMQAVAAESSKRSFTEALPANRHRLWGAAAAVFAIATIAILSAMPRAGWNALKRWLMPLAPTERYTFARLENPPDSLVVPYGEAFEVTLHLAGDSEQRPGSGTGRYGSQPEVAASLSNDRYRFTFPGQQDPGVIVFRLGDLTHRLRVQPMTRPAVERVSASIEAPAYLGIPTRTFDVATGVVSAVEGSRVSILLETDRPLAEASFGPSRAVIMAEPAAKQAAHAPQAGELFLSGSRATTAPFEVSSHSIEIPFQWRDEWDLAGEPGFNIRIDGVPDAAPTCYIQGIDRQKVILPEETLDFEILAEDDFGASELGIEWQGRITRPTDEAPANDSLKLAEGGTESTRLSSDVAFSPAAFGITPQTLQLRAYTTDRFPGRGRVYSEPITIYVLTRDEHANMLKTRFDRQISELEDLARRELGLLEENEELDKLDGEQLQTDEARQKLEKQQDEEAETERRAENLTERMEQLLKDAARNGEIDKKTMQKMAEALKSLQELSAKDIPKVEQKLGESGEPSNTPEKSDSDLREAVEQQRKNVEKMREAIEKANEANRKFEAGAFVNRLKKAASEEGGIASALKQSFENLLGLAKSSLHAAESRRLAETARQQAVTAADIRWIQEDLGNYIVRSENPAFKTVYEGMRDSGIDIGLDDVRAKLETNHSFQAAEGANRWSEKLNEWAKLLSDEANNGSGSGGGGQSPEDEDFEFMLRVMKMVQQEIDLRGRTRTLEQLRRDFQNPPMEP